MYIAWGHWTPVFVKRNEKLKENRCLSIVAKDGRVLDLEGYNRSITELWVRGLRKLMGHSDEESEEMAKRNLKNLMDGAYQREKPITTVQTDNVKNIIKLQQDLYIMTTHTVLRNLQEERVWRIDQEVRDQFKPQKMWPNVLKRDIPWRHWQQWLREQVTSFCREKGKINMPQPVVPPLYPQPHPVVYPNPMVHPQPQPVVPNVNPWPIPNVMEQNNQIARPQPGPNENCVVN